MIKKINQDQYKEVLESPYAIVDFSATWCGPCKMLAPILEQLSDEYEGKVNFYNIDVDDNEDLAVKYNINSIPYVLALKNGEPFNVHIGFAPEETIKDFIDALLA